jgi:transcriptional regulator with XRE-family HTH domain
MSINISNNQIKAARALLRLSVNELASLSEVSPSTIRRLESQVDYNSPNQNTVTKLKTALESRGIEFLGTSDKDPGVRLKSL